MSFSQALSGLNAASQNLDAWNALFTAVAETMLEGRDLAMAVE